MKIYNSQLVMSLVYRSTSVHFTTIVQRRSMSGHRASWRLVLNAAKTKTTGPVYLITMRTKFRTGRVKDWKTIYKYEAVPDHPATATQLPY